ncbi:MAG: ribonuclease Z [Candidatus Heimdallarchaeota archaeon]|nr:ribonuclease Z [Candidatus Heimdallarchaeota archaeon]
MSDKFSVTFLGTSSAPPQVERRQSSIAIKYKNHNLLVDVGEATQVQMLKHKIGFSNLTILLTHLHSDHTLGLIGLLTTRSFYDISRSITIIGPPWTSSFIFLQLLAHRLNPDYEIKVIETNGGLVLSNSDFYIESFPVSHGVNCFGYKIVSHQSLGVFNVERAIEKNIPKGTMWKKLQNGTPIEVNGDIINPSEILDVSPIKPIKIVITGDTPLDEHVINHSSNADLLVHDSTYPHSEKLRAKKHFHSTCTDAAFVAKIANVNKLVLTHFSELHNNLNESLKKSKEIFTNCILAYDGLTVHV